MQQDWSMGLQAMFYKIAINSIKIKPLQFIT